MKVDRGHPLAPEQAPDPEQGQRHAQQGQRQAHQRPVGQGGKTEVGGVGLLARLHGLPLVHHQHGFQGPISTPVGNELLDDARDPALIGRRPGKYEEDALLALPDRAAALRLAHALSPAIATWLKPPST